MKYGNDDLSGQDEVARLQRASRRFVQLSLRDRRELISVLKAAQHPRPIEEMTKEQMVIAIIQIEDAKSARDAEEKEPVGLLQQRPVDEWGFGTN